MVVIFLINLIILLSKKMNKIKLNSELPLYGTNIVSLYNSKVANNITNHRKTLVNEIESKIMLPKLSYKDLPENLKEQLQEEIRIINDIQHPENLYNNIILSIGTVDSIANIFGLPFGLVMKLRELNKRV